MRRRVKTPGRARFRRNAPTIRRSLVRRALWSLARSVAVTAPSPPPVVILVAEKRSVRHELFAILENPTAATSALSEICTRPELEGRYSVVVHRDGIEQANTDPVLAHEERGTNEGFHFGALLGALGGVTALAMLELPFPLMGGGPAFPAL